MPLYSKQSLETLRERIDLAEVLGSYIELKRTGASYKALCPFHDEKSPSFIINKGDSHYHCFGCGAHGDAIQFLVEYQKLSFSEALETLAEKFHVVLEVVEGEEKGPSKTYMKEALEFAADFFHFYLLHTAHGHRALEYLYSRGLDLEFIERFRIGLAPEANGTFRETMHGKRFTDDIMVASGLLSEANRRELFHDRIMFPILDPAGAPIGFSGRKFQEETFGGKYVNTPETPLFKKSKVLYGLNYSRRRIAKERQVIVVEGQIDALRLVQAGFDYTVAGQGTAFGEGHVRELLNLGVHQVWLAFDSDTAGMAAAVKVGDLFQKAGVGVGVVTLPPKSDPDSYLRERGPDAFATLVENAKDYLVFLVDYYATKLDMRSPAEKNELVQTIATQIRAWDQPVMVQESLRKLAHLTKISESLIGVDTTRSPNIYIKNRGTAGIEEVDGDEVLEMDFLRWVLAMGGTYLELAKENITKEMLRSPSCARIYSLCLEGPRDSLSLLSQLDSEKEQKILTQLGQKMINKERAEKQFAETIQRILDRNWMLERERIKMKIQSGECKDEEVLELVKEFESVKKPKIKEIACST